MEIKVQVSRIRSFTNSNMDCTVGLLTSDHLKIPIFSLEDKERTVKIPGKTAIPTGVYKMSKTVSPRFKRNMVLLENVPNFSGIRVHPGNTVEDTEGCLLLGLGLRYNQNTNIFNLTDSIKAVAIFEQLFDIKTASSFVMEIR
jgi:hypothetical protein